MTAIPRTLRVYDPRGDFNISIPEDARVTFGYFNPAASERTQNKYGGFDGPGAQTMRTTALRIYLKPKGEPETQLACFLGITGFRDSKITLTRLSNKVVIEQNLVDDGEGTIEYSGKRQKQLIAVTEPGSYQ